MHYFSASPSSFILLHILSLLTLLFVVLCSVKKRLKLRSRYRQCVEAAIEYARTIDDFDDMVDLRTVALHCPGPEPSTYVLRTIEIEEKKSKRLHSSSFQFFFFFYKCLLFAEMMTKFN